jgi:hypothetical protein
MKSTRSIRNSEVRNLGACFAVLTLFTLGTWQAAAAPKGPDKGQFTTRFFEVTISETINGEPSPNRIFWPVTDDDPSLRIGRLEDGTNPIILINRNNCGGLVEGCEHAAFIPVRLSTEVESACFPGDDLVSGIHYGTAAIVDNGTTFGIGFYGRGMDGKTQYYRFSAVCEPLDDWFETFLDLDPDHPNPVRASATFRLTSWTLAPATGPGGSKSACIAAGSFLESGLEVIVTVLRKK